ncbi:MAG: hypothetical protein ABI282_01360 [Candidatus Baltobacteraceae bacterium]
MRQFIAPSSLAFGLALALLAGCGGGGSGSGGVDPLPGSTATPVPTATPAPPGSSTQTIVTNAGAVNGKTGQFQPAEGDTIAGGQGQPVDGKACTVPTLPPYHIHFFVGLWVNGVQMALPAGVGMNAPQPPVNGFVDLANCVYPIHTHDSSGVVHVEDPDSKAPITQSIYTLKNFFDEWGITVNAGQFGSFAGPVRVFTSGQTYRGDVKGQTVPATDLTFFGTDANAVPIYSYEIIDIEVGPTFPSSLPNVFFYLSH